MIKTKMHREIKKLAELIALAALTLFLLTAFYEPFASFIRWIYLDN